MRKRAKLLGPDVQRLPTSLRGALHAWAAGMSVVALLVILVLVTVATSVLLPVCLGVELVQVHLVNLVRQDGLVPVVGRVRRVGTEGEGTAGTRTFKQRQLYKGWQEWQE